MDLRVLRFCEVIARLGSFTRAAEEIHIAQPALSIAVGKLEEELGVPLFHRFPRGVTPTSEGKVLLARAARVFEEVDSARREIADVSELRTGSIKIGFPPMYGLHYFPKLIMSFHKRYPGVEITAFEGSATDVRDRLNAGTAETIDSERRNLFRHARFQPDVARSVDRVTRRLQRIADDHVIHLVGGETTALQGAFGRDDRKIDRADIRKTAVVLGHRGSGPVNDDDFFQKLVSSGETGMLNVEC